MRKIQFEDVAKGVPFVIFENDWNNVYMKIDNRMVCIANKYSPTRLTDNEQTSGTVYLVDPAEITFNTQPEPEPKYKAGDLVKVLDDAWTNVLVGQIVTVNSYRGIQESGKYRGQYSVEVVGARLDGSEVGQSVPESSLELVCSK